MNRAETIAKMAKDPEQLQLIGKLITKAVSDSFHEDARRDGWARVVATQQEVRERTNVAYDWLIKLRMDHGYSTQKALDCLPLALRAHLDGTEWEPPPADRSWATEN